MTDPDDDFAPPPPRARFRWVRKLAFWGLGLFAAIAFVLFLGRWQTGRLGQRQLTVTTNRLDADDPGWRLDAIMAARKKAEPARDENAARLVLEIADGVPDEWKKWRGSKETALWDQTGDNRLPPQDAITSARSQAVATSRVRAQALGLCGARGGQFAVTVEPDPLGTLLPHVEKCLTVAALLRYDGHLSALEKAPNRGISSARAALGVARAIGDEPFLGSQFGRMKCATAAVQTAMQVFARGEPTEGLAELQAELFAEAEVPYLRIGLRGERGMVDALFRGLEEETIPSEHWIWIKYAGINEIGSEYAAAFRAYRALLPGDHAKALDTLTGYLEATNRPPHEQLAALSAVSPPMGPPNEFRHVITWLVVPPYARTTPARPHTFISEGLLLSEFAEAELQCRANLLCAATGIACERFRRKNGRWPGALTDLLPAFLPAVPQNPFDGTPLSYRTFQNRIAVYCFWANAPLKQEYPDEFRGDVPGIGYGCRLWDPDRRGRPAEEKKGP
ncbi:hypothetical protein [Frigoriglobus tundricola]|uniref:Long-chain-fatty-acid--CoA ligase n=1 Tax=Frigoriglobus tundricola TaxID=2774151 RepID=A0A6M5YHI2_9BACT|nr:hypothetical protein [Frigoriglobus tundricola]QJW93515.1 Long-chain-fatty-acid--CoA ligase [Frigoriglobus tundricola]